MIRKATLADIPKLQTLFIDTVLNVNSKDYSKNEVEAWARTGENKFNLQDLFTKYNFYIIEKENKISGFTSINSNGFIHSFFVSYNHQRQGVGQKLMDYLFSLIDSYSIH